MQILDFDSWEPIAHTLSNLFKVEKQYVYDLLFLQEEETNAKI